jgi:lipopolysaccharide/colanic/teichoic acid biosynthesis glycosyltransferase
MYRDYIKRFLDLIICILALPIFILICIPVALAIKLDDYGPIFYLGKRIGRGMKEFSMVKFRSMQMNSPDIRNENGSTFKSGTDPRLTRVGKILRKTSIDEIPQIINIFKGDMSLVGPRPSPIGNENLYPERYFRKFTIRPGITGYNQAILRNKATMEQRINNDLYYVDHISFLMDLKITWLTLLFVLRRKNIYSDEVSG